MSHHCYVDTNVIAAYYCQDANSASAEKFLLGHTGPSISTLTEVEFVAVLAKKMRRKELKSKDMVRILNLFSEHREGYFRILSVKPECYKMAKELLISHPKLNLSSLDALHLAIAATEKINFVTLDKELLQIAKKAGLLTVSIG